LWDTPLQFPLKNPLIPCHAIHHPRYPFIHIGYIHIYTHAYTHLFI
jgi:hypothetical protein